MSPRKPRDLRNYESAEMTAKWLEVLAKSVRTHATEYPLLKLTMKVSLWNPAWKQPKEPQ